MLRSFFRTRAHFSLELAIKRQLPKSLSASSGDHVTPVLDSLSPSMAADVVRKLGRIRRPKHTDAVLALLRSYGFSAAQITTIVERRPDVLCLKPQTLRPKLDFFLSVGVSASDVPRLLSSYSRLIHASLSDRIAPNFEKLKSVYGRTDKVVEAICSSPVLLFRNLDDCFLPNVEALRRHGFSDDLITAFIKKKPRAVFTLPDRFEQLAAQFKEMGYDLSAGGVQTRALLVASGICGKTMEKKLALLKRLGWSESDILGAFRRMPNFLEVSEEKLEKRIQFYINQLKWRPSSIAERPTLLMLSIERRLIPRLSVFNLLVQKGKICKPMYEINLVVMSEKRFLKGYIHKYQDEIPEVVDAYQGRLQLAGFELDCNKPHNIKALLQHGLPSVTIKKLIVAKSKALLVSPPHLKAVLEGLIQMEFDVYSNTFCEALTVLATMSNLTSKEKFAFFQSLGWSDTDVISALKKYPKYVTVPEEKVQRLVKFFEDELDWKAPKIAANPRLLLLDLEECILPRYSIYGVLASHKLLEKKTLTVDFFLMVEKRFLAKFVSNLQQKLPNLLEMYKDALCIHSTRPEVRPGTLL